MDCQSGCPLKTLSSLISHESTRIGCARHRAVPQCGHFRVNQFRSSSRSFVAQSGHGGWAAQSFQHSPAIAQSSAARITRTFTRESGLDISASSRGSSFRVQVDLDPEKIQSFARGRAHLWRILTYSCRKYQNIQAFQNSCHSPDGLRANHECKDRTPILLFHFLRAYPARTSRISPDMPEMPSSPDFLFNMSSI